MDGEYNSDVLHELDLRVARALPRWDLAADTAIRLLSVSENATYLLRDPRGRDVVLRVHRIGYSSATEIRSELAWIQALRAEGVIDTAAPIAGVDGEWVQSLAPIAAGPARFAVAFERLPGGEPDARNALHWFERLGELTARMHAHARSWVLPSDFTRKRWDIDAMVGPQGFWGPWRAAPGLGAAGTRILERTVDLIAERLARFGQAPAVFGLVHADLRLANLLVDGPHLRIIDFDDCGFSWFVYDFAAALSFIEHEAVVPDLLCAWCRGYGRAGVLDDDARAQIPTFVVLRRIMLTAWLASHAEVPFARELGTGYTAGTVQLAQALLRGKLMATATA